MPHFDALKIYGFKQFLPFSKCFLPYLALIFHLTLSQTSPGFDVSAVQVFWKTLWEKEKLLVTSNFSFSCSVSYSSGELPAIFIKYEIIIYKLFQFVRV